MRLTEAKAVATFLWAATRGYRLRPWASPYLRWRIETYWGWPAESVTFGRFWKFSWRQRGQLARYLKWVGEMGSATRRVAPTCKTR